MNEKSGTLKESLERNTFAIRSRYVAGFKLSNLTTRSTGRLKAVSEIPARGERGWKGVVEEGKGGMSDG